MTVCSYRQGMRDRWLLVTGVAVTALVCAAATWFPQSSPPPQFSVSGVVVNEAGEPLGRCLLDSLTGEESGMFTRRDGTFPWPFRVFGYREYDVGARCEGGEVASDTVLVTGDMYIRLVAR
ncbi:hypothetical protein C1I64_07530 [Rathayibacter festucae DSM 15932]|uniref:Carboxypeptidase regulatory-like domain-containing protein n=2 Tax=Rathayibacter festucae TaxID=110937 RepID=A0A3Q9UQS7_9MICO|nr:hypothetical protein C1I64_07530 [Rathayibacter festucae DSM 15932]